MTDNVIPFGGITKLDLPVSQILEYALKADLECVVVVGLTKDGAEYFAASQADGSLALWHMERAKYQLMKITDEMMDD